MIGTHCCSILIPHEVSHSEINMFDFVPPENQNMYVFRKNKIEDRFIMNLLLYKKIQLGFLWKMTIASPDWSQIDDLSTLFEKNT